MATDEPTPNGVGRRIHELRALRGFSLAELGAKAHVSGAMLSYIERGERTPSEQVISAVARALRVKVSVLHGQPYIDQLRKDQLDRVIAPLSAALGQWDIPPDDNDPPPRPLHVLETEVQRLQEMRRNAEYGGAAEAVAGLLLELLHTAWIVPAPGAEHERVHSLMSEAAVTAHQVALKFGYMDLAGWALSRAAQAAMLSGDPRQVANERVRRGMLMTDDIDPAAGVRLMRRALRDLDDDGTVPTRAVRGSLLLAGVTLLGVVGDSGEAESWLEEARGRARETGETDHYLVSFGPTNTELHGVRAAADRDDHGHAVEIARAVEIPDTFSANKTGELLIYTARSLALTAQPDKSLEALERAKQVSPQQARYHPVVRTTVGALLRARPRPSDQLRAYAAWSGV